MRDQLRSYIDSLFEEAPKTRKAYELREELLSNLNAKYDDLINRGQPEEEAYKAAVEGIGNVSELIAALGESHEMDQEKYETERRKSALIVSASVALYILSIVPILVLQDVRGVICMFIVMAFATGLIVYNAMARPKYRKADETVVEEFKEWNSANGDNRRIRKSISAAMWPLIVVIYFVVSFYWDSWYISWIIFIIGAAIENIIKLAFDLKK